MYKVTKTIYINFIKPNRLKLITTNEKILKIITLTTIKLNNKRFYIHEISKRIKDFKKISQILNNKSFYIHKISKKLNKKEVLIKTTLW